MNAPVSIEPTLCPIHRVAIEQANCWRGRCVNHFARGELILGEALLASPNPRLLPMLLSQRLSRLEGMIKSDAKKITALEGFKLEIDDRNAIVHGAGKVTVDEEGRWCLALHVLDRSGRNQLHISQAESEERARRLKSAVDRLRSALELNSRTPGPSGTPS